MRHVALGLDFGTESCRALLVDVRSGEELASAVHRYRHGVIDELLPEGTTRLGTDWALQHPEDYPDAMRHAIPEALAASGVTPEQVIGIGVDFTACTVLPTTADGTPLSNLERFRRAPHAWPKLWKHHAAQSQADRITQLATTRGERWLERYGGRVSSEWLHSKALQMLEEAPDVFAATDRFLEAGDWVVWWLVGREMRNTTGAGYKALWNATDGYPSSEFLRSLDTRFADFTGRCLDAPIASPGTRAGGLRREVAAQLGLAPGTPVSVATVDAHASVPGAGVADTGRMVLILGTSTCHMIMGNQLNPVPGIGGVVEGGIVPGLFGYEAGQAASGDMLEWFVEHSVPGRYEAVAAERGVDVYALLEHDASAMQPGESGLVALDWWNGNRSVLNDAALSGMILGLRLSTRAPEIFRALIEATAYGTRVIIEAFEESAVAVNELIGCGGLAARNRLLMQIYADVTGREFRRAASNQTSALGAAMYGAVAAGANGGGHRSISDAVEHMAPEPVETFHPDSARHAIYDRLFAEYKALHDYFGRGANQVMRRLRR